MRELLDVFLQADGDVNNAAVRGVTRVETGVSMQCEQALMKVTSCEGMKDDCKYEIYSSLV